MLYAVRNRIRAILTPRGLAAALAWGGGIKSSSVQLVQLHTERMSQLVSRLSLAKERFKNFFTRCNDVVFRPSPGPCINTIDDVDEAIRTRRKFCFHASAYSGIDGTEFEVQLGLKNDEVNFKATVKSHQCNGGLAYDQTAESDDDGIDGGAESAVLQEGDFSTTHIPEGALVVCDEDREVDSDSSDDSDSTESSDSGLDELPVREYVYGPTNHDGTDHLTGTVVVKQDGVHRSEINASVVCSKNDENDTNVVDVDSTNSDSDEVETRVDLVAFGVRYAANQIHTHAVCIRDGRLDAPEYQLSRATSLSARPQGWGRRPRHGDTMGARYLPEFVQDVTALFNRGACKSSLKLGPAQMRDELKRKYPSRFSIPSRAELRTYISALFMKAKNSSTGMVDSNRQISGRRGRRSLLPDTVRGFVTQLINANPEMKAAEALKRVRAQFPDLPLEATDSRIKNRIANAKSLSKRSGHEL